MQLNSLCLWFTFIGDDLDFTDKFPAVNCKYICASFALIPYFCHGDILLQLLSVSVSHLSRLEGKVYMTMQFCKPQEAHQTIQMRRVIDDYITSLEAFHVVLSELFRAVWKALAFINSLTSKPTKMHVVYICLSQENSSL